MGSSDRRRRSHRSEPSAMMAERDCSQGHSRGQQDSRDAQEEYMNVGSDMDVGSDDSGTDPDMPPLSVTDDNGNLVNRPLSSLTALIDISRPLGALFPGMHAACQVVEIICWRTGCCSGRWLCWATAACGGISKRTTASLNPWRRSSRTASTNSPGVPTGCPLTRRAIQPGVIPSSSAWEPLLISTTSHSLCMPRKSAPRLREMSTSAVKLERAD